MLLKLQPVLLQPCILEVCALVHFTRNKLANLRQKVVLHKTGKFLQASVAQVVFKLPT